MGLGVRLGPADVSRPKASESAALLKFTFIMNLLCQNAKSVKIWNIQIPKKTVVVYTKNSMFTIFFRKKAYWKCWSYHYADFPPASGAKTEKNPQQSVWLCCGKSPVLMGQNCGRFGAPNANGTSGAPNTCFASAHLIAGLFTAGLDLHVLIVFHRKAVVYNSCALVEGIGR